MHEEFAFHINSTRFDENYQPSSSTRLTTNFANLARGTSRQQNLRDTLRMIDNRCNELAHWDNPAGDRYTVELEIISVEMCLDAQASASGFPLIEMLKPCIWDGKENKRIDGIAGNNFSSYVRDYDFSVLLPEYNADRAEFGLPVTIGRALEFVPKERLFPCTNCGMAPMARHVAWRKLEALAAGTRLAKERLTTK